MRLHTRLMLQMQVSTASVACGVLGVGGNKGAVAVGFTLHRRKFAVVCSHFAAHQARALLACSTCCLRNATVLLIASAEPLLQRLTQKHPVGASHACAATLVLTSRPRPVPCSDRCCACTLQAAWEARNANYAHIAGSLSFSKRQWLAVEGEAPRNASPLKVAKGQAAVAARADSAEDLTHPADHSGSDQGDDEDAEEEFQVSQRHVATGPAPGLTSSLI